jgi:hypothetical protein
VGGVEGEVTAQAGRPMGADERFRESTSGEEAAQERCGTRELGPRVCSGPRDVICNGVWCESANTQSVPNVDEGVRNFQLACRNPVRDRVLQRRKKSAQRSGKADMQRGSTTRW